MWRVVVQARQLRAHIDTFVGDQTSLLQQLPWYLHTRESGKRWSTSKLESYNIMYTAKRKPEVRENVVAEHSADAGPTARFIMNIDLFQHQLLHMYSTLPEITMKFRLHYSFMIAIYLVATSVHLQVLIPLEALIANFTNVSVRFHQGFWRQCHHLRIWICTFWHIKQ